MIFEKVKASRPTFDMNTDALYEMEVAIFFSFPLKMHMKTI